jgi:threonine dehydrogenase-like Zn-dependent dehydrogenase
VPDALPDETAALVEPFAAALHAVHTVAPRPGDRVAVLGPRRLGMLVIAALDAERRRDGADFEIVAAARRPALEPLARDLGADAFVTVDAAGLPTDFADVVIDTTGAPEGLVSALRAARREVHLKSTAGRPAAGLRHPTELVVDELRVTPHAGEPPAGPVAWLAAGAPPPGLDAVTGPLAELARRAAAAPFETAVVDTAEGADAAIRPEPGVERSLLRPGGTIRVVDGPAAGARDAALLHAVAGRGIVVSTSRCGDFDAALARLGDDPRLAELGPRLVSHRFGPDALAEAFRVAASPEARKVLVVHPAA